MFCCGKGKECQIVCDGKVMANISCSEDGMTIKPTEEAKAMHKEMCKEGKCECGK
ncbi:MAG: hypothetical protein ABIH83_00445 [Candidatus Micrarchaeota archaeon]